MKGDGTVVLKILDPKHYRVKMPSSGEVPLSFVRDLLNALGISFDYTYNKAIIEKWPEMFEEIP